MKGVGGWKSRSQLEGHPQTSALTAMPIQGSGPGLRGLKMKQHPRCPGQLCLQHKLHPEGPPTGRPQRSGESGDTVCILSSVPLILHLLKHPLPYLT